MSYVKFISETFAKIRSFSLMNRVVTLILFCVFTAKDLTLFGPRSITDLLLNFAQHH